MKKYIIAAFLLVVLFVSSVVPAYADQLSFGLDLISQGLGILYDDHAKADQMLAAQSSIQSLWQANVSTANSGTCITADDLYNLCLNLNESGFSCYVYELNSRYVIKGRSTATITHTHYDGKVTYYPIYIGATYYCTPAGRVYYATTLPADTNLTAIRNYVDGLEGYAADIETILNKIEGRFTYTTGGVAYSIASRCYYINQKLDALDPIQDILSKINGHFTYTTGGTSYSIANRCYYISRRLDDILTALGNQSVSVNLKDLNLTLDTSRIDISANTSYCIISLTDSSGTDYDYTVIPYDTAVSMLSRLNTDYIGDTINQLSTDGQNTYSRTVLDANLTEDGFIMVNTTNGRHYFLCNSSRMIYYIDPTTNYGLHLSQSISSVLNRLDTIIANMQGEVGLSGCNHQYASEVKQDPTCTLPGLMDYTCELCGSCYSEIMPSLGHDWVCSDHVESVLDDDGNVLQSGYDIYICQTCHLTYYDYDGTGAPGDESGSTITDLITRVFSKLGSFVGGLISSIINLLDKLLTGFDQIVTDFNDRTNQILDFGGDYPAWLGGVWEIIPQEMQLALSFCIVVMALGIIGKKVVFS